MWFLREWMQAKGIRKQSDMMKLTGWSKATMSQLYNGKQDFSPKILREAAEALHQALEELGLPYGIAAYQRDVATRLAPPELKAVHPLGKSPVLQDGDPAYWYHHTGAGYLAMGERFYLSFKSLVQPGSVPLYTRRPRRISKAGCRM